jgi:hypothetical protein
VHVGRLFVSADVRKSGTSCISKDNDLFQLLTLRAGSPPFMEREDYLLCSQELATWPCPGSDELSVHPHVLFL